MRPIQERRTDRERVATFNGVLQGEGRLGHPPEAFRHALHLVVDLHLLFSGSRALLLLFQARNRSLKILNDAVPFFDVVPACFSNRVLIPLSCRMSASSFGSAMCYFPSGSMMVESQANPAQARCYTAPLFSAAADARSRGFLDFVASATFRSAHRLARAEIEGTAIGGRAKRRRDQESSAACI